MFHQRAGTPLTLKGHDAARDFFAARLADLPTEQLWVAHVDRACRCVHLAYYQGAEELAELPVREILLDAARHDTAGLVLAHNHPSGDPSPSDSDRRATRRLATIAEAIDVTVLDHLVFAGQDSCSFRRRGLL